MNPCTKRSKNRGKYTVADPGFSGGEGLPYEEIVNSHFLHFNFKSHVQRD